MLRANKGLVFYVVYVFLRGTLGVALLTKSIFFDTIMGRIAN